MPTHNTILSGQRVFTLSPLTSSRVSAGVKRPRGPLPSLPPGPPALPKAWGRRGVPLSAAAGLDTLRASVKLRGLERQTDRGRETNSRKTRQAAEPTPRGSVFAPNNVERVLGQFVSKSARHVPSSVLTEASLVLKVNQSWPRPRGSGLRVRGSPGGLGGAAAGSWALLRCPRLQARLAPPAAEAAAKRLSG